MKKHLLAAPALAALSLLPPCSLAQDQAVRIVNPDLKAAAFWTPERLKAATPLPMQEGAPQALADSTQAPPPTGQPQAGDGKPPSLTLRLPVRRLFTPERGQERVIVSPRASGTDGTAPYTSSRVFPLFEGAAAGYSADRAYPYITAGRLFFTANGVPRFCSASVIQRRIVVTAGHCVHTGNIGGFYNNWMFVPAFRDGGAPLLTWNWRAAIVTATWATSNGFRPNAADYAMIEFADQPVNGTPRALGDVTGWLGWQTLSLQLNHTTKLGYACNLDNCQKMQQITSADVGATVANNVVSGSDAKEGFNGAPWIQNFQVLQAGGGAGSNNGSNRVVGVVSYFSPTGPFNVQAQSSPQPDGRWVDIFNRSCARAPDNCR